MTLLKIYNLEATEDLGEVCTFAEGEHIIGRGDILNCNDKRVSRKHALITVGKDVVTIKSVHINPCFFKASSGNSVTILPKDTSVVLHDGDHFALLADVFWFKVRVVCTGDSVSSNKNVLTKEQDGIEVAENGLNGSEAPSTYRLENITTNISSSNKRGADEETSEDNKRTKISNEDEDDSKMDTSNMTISRLSSDSIGLEASTSTQVNPSSENSVANIDSNKLINSLKYILEEDYGNKSDVKFDVMKKEIDESDRTDQKPNLPTTSNGDKSKMEATDETIKIKKEKIDYDESVHQPGGSNYINNNDKNKGDTTASANSVDSDIKVEKSEEEDTTRIKTESSSENNENDPSCSRDNEDRKKARRERCWYGPTCYRKNPVHLQDFSHPGDNDYDSDPEDDRPQCPFGGACYRRNIDHRRQFKHPNRPAAKPSDSDGTPKQKRNTPKKKPNPQDSSQDDLDDDDDDDDDDGVDGTNQRKRRAAAKKTTYKEETPDDYDYEDPFIDDGSSDAYEVSNDEDSEDSEYEDSQAVDEESQETRRLLKEAKRFTKGKGKKKGT